MKDFDLNFNEINYAFRMIFVEGTGDKPFLFGIENDTQQITIKDFFISKFTVTQLVWEYIMKHDPSNHKGNNMAVECVSYSDIINEGGFLEKINASNSKEEPSKQFQKTSSLQFRLPTESEWEYAAKGGIYWKDNFIYSGSNNIDEVAWYKNNSRDKSKPVGQKKPNQLGIHDMSGNLWEWCHDHFQENTNKIPKDGSPCLEESGDRVLRGGCFHNWDIHCTTTKRYEIMPEYKDPCIGFRLVLPL